MVRPHEQDDPGALVRHLRDAERREDLDAVEEICRRLVELEAWGTLMTLAGRLLDRAEARMASAMPPRGRLVVFRSSGLFLRQRAYSLDSSDIFVIGRGEKSSVCIRSYHFSRHHFQLIRSPGGFILRDLESTNGTMLNGLRVGFAPIFSGDQITVADVSFRFEQESETPDFLWTEMEDHLHPVKHPSWIGNLVRCWAPRTPAAPNPFPLYARALRLWSGAASEAWLQAVGGDEWRGEALRALVLLLSGGRLPRVRPTPPFRYFLERGFIRELGENTVELGPRCPKLPLIPAIPPWVAARS